MGRLRTAAIATSAALLVLAGCGTTEKPGAAPTPATDTGPVTVTDSRGKAVTLDHPASRVVALEWGEAEMLVTLGVMPVGVADPRGYGTWVTAEKLDAGVTDVGTRGEPSVDAIVALQPDLVVMEAERDAPLVAQLEKYFPVVVTKGSDASDNLQRMRADFTMIARAVGKTGRASAVLAGFDSAVAAGKARIAAAGAAGKSFAIADGWIDGGTVSIRPFGEGALVSQVGIALGLRNAWTGPVDAAWGLGQTDVEGLTALDAAKPQFFYNASEAPDPFVDGLGDNPIWKSLSFVQSGQIHKMPDGIWTFGGPASCTQYLDQLVQVFAP